VFGAGLALSGMTDPSRVLGFLDVAGDWDPTLAFVMGGALLVTFPSFPAILRRSRPWLRAAFSLPTRKAVDVRLLAGATFFGVGWGLAGFCPGPAVAALALAPAAVWPFVAAMIAGMALAQRLPEPSEPTRVGDAFGASDC
jgi:hypothetical protein